MALLRGEVPVRGGGGGVAGFSARLCRSLREKERGQSWLAGSEGMVTGGTAVVPPGVVGARQPAAAPVVQIQNGASEAVPVLRGRGTGEFSSPLSRQQLWYQQTYSEGCVCMSQELAGFRCGDWKSLEATLDVPVTESFFCHIQPLPVLALTVQDKLCL